MFHARRFIAAVVLAGTFAGTPALAETQTENIVAESRTYLYFAAPAEALQTALPAGWTSNPIAAGPAKGATLILVLIDRKLALQPDGTPLATGFGRFAVGVLPGRNAAGEARNFVYTGASADPAGAPGAYKVYAPGTVTLDRAERAVAGELAKTVDETWTATTTDGTLQVHVAYTGGLPAVSTFESKTYSAAEPDFYRIYRGEQAVDVVRSVANGIDRATSAEATGTGSFAAVSGAPIVAVSSFPLYRRLTFLP